MNEIKERETPMLEKLVISWSKLPKLTNDLFWKIWEDLKDRSISFQEEFYALVNNIATKT